MAGVVKASSNAAPRIKRHWAIATCPSRLPRAGVASSVRASGQAPPRGSSALFRSRGHTRRTSPFMASAPRSPLSGSE
jgi:hypothetical protein